DAGAGLVLGSDAPVAPLDPWLAMAAAVHRSADEREAWFPAQQLQPREALAASTDGVVALEPGGRGDVVLLDEGHTSADLSGLFADVPSGADGLMVDTAARESAHRRRAAEGRATVVAGRRGSERWAGARPAAPGRWSRPRTGLPRRPWLRRAAGSGSGDGLSSDRRGRHR